MYQGEDRRKQHECIQHELLREMHGDLKEIKNQLTTLNGSVLSNKKAIIEHVGESTPYRKKIDDVWAIIHTLKYIVMLIFGTGLLFRAIEFMK